MAPSRIDLAGSGTIQIQVELDDVAKAFAGWARAERAVEAEPPRLWIGECAVAKGAFQATGKIESLPWYGHRSVVLADDAVAVSSVAFYPERHRPPVALLERRFE